MFCLGQYRPETEMDRKYTDDIPYIRPREDFGFFVRRDRPLRRQGRVLFGLRPGWYIRRRRRRHRRCCCRRWGTVGPNTRRYSKSPFLHLTLHYCRANLFVVSHTYQW